jgi:glycosidase
MEGARDPDCRRGMMWDESKWDHDLLKTARQYISLRSRYRALRHPGKYVRLAAEGPVYAFARQLDGETVVVAMNAGTKPARLDLDVSAVLPDGAPCKQEWGHGTQTVSGGKLKRIQIPARDGVVWVEP